MPRGRDRIDGGRSPVRRSFPHRKGMIGRQGPVVRAFRAVGWQWGGRRDGFRDYQHFSATGG